VRLARRSDRSGVDEPVDAIDEFLRAEGLGEVVEGSQFQTKIPRVGGRPSRDDHNGDGRRGRIPAQDLANPEAVQIGQHEVQQDDIRTIGSHAVDGLPAIGSGGHFMAGPDQMIMHQVGQFRFVVYGEDFGAGVHPQSLPD
jgi:hypothetical protein